MRFFKIFIIAFLSLIGVIGGAVGVMYLTGALNKQVIEPEAIYFEFAQNQTGYYISDDTYIKILSETEDVTETEITLSLGASTTQEGTENGKIYITDGIIKVPKFVMLGQAFKVELCKEINAEVGGQEWIVGGISSLTAKSQSLKASQITTNVNVDVPVHSIKVITYANESYTTPITEFASGETFYAKAEFVPALSAYKFGQDGTNGKPMVMKNVYFDPISATSTTLQIEENAQINQTLIAQGVSNVKAFNAISSTTDLTMNAYAFINSSLEDQIVQNSMGNTDQILAELKNSNLGQSAQTNLEIQNVVINSFTITPNLTTKTLKFNQINQIYANYGDSNNSLNFGVEITSTTQQSQPNLQSKIKNIGLQVYAKSGSSYIKAEPSTYLFVDSLGEVIEPTNEYYLPTFVASDVNKSHWNFVPMQAGVEFAFVLTILTDSFQPDDAVAEVATYNTSTQQKWQTSNIEASTISWLNQNDINLTVIDNIDPESVKSEEFDLTEIISFTEGTYKIVRYIAYANEPGVDLSGVITGAKYSTAYDNYALSIPDTIQIYEIPANIKLLPSSVSNFNVRAVVLENDYLGRLTEDYTIFSATTAKSVNITKTVKSVSAHIEVSNSSLLKNFDAQNPDQPLTKLAFLMGTNENIFDVVFNVSADNETALQKEVEIFLNDYNNNKIILSTYISGEQKNVVTTIGGVGEYVSQTEWEYRIPYFAGSANRDAELRFEFSYNQTNLISYNKSINQVVFNVEADNKLENAQMADNLSSAVVELYDGKVYTLEFKYDNAVDTPITQSTEISGSEICQDGQIPVYYADTISRKYSFNGEQLDSIVNSDTGEFEIIAKDKFGNQIDSSTYSCEPTVENTALRTTYYLLSTKEYSSVLTQSPTDKLYFVDTSGLAKTQVAYNQGSITMGAWAPSDIASGFTSLTEDEANGDITIKRIGVKNEVIQLAGKNGLLSIRYNIDGETPKIYELCNKITYTLITPTGAYADVLAYDETNNTITILKTIGSTISLNISATTALGTSYNVKLVIEPNISISLTRLTAQGSLAETETISNIEYFLMYSNNDVKFKLEVSFTLVEQLELSLDKGLFTNNENIVRVTPEFSAHNPKAVVDFEFILNFEKTSLDKQYVLLSTDLSSQSQYIFKTTINFIVKPNITFEQTTLNKHLTISSFNEVYDIITDDDLKRILGQEDLSLSDVAIAFAKTEDGTFKDRVYVNNKTTPLTENIFAWNNINKKLSLLSTMEAMFEDKGEYTAYFEVKYGAVSIGEIKVKISTNIAVSLTSDDFSSRFAYYNNQKYLVFQSGEQGLTQDYLKSLFTNVEKIDFVVDGNYITNQNGVYSVKSTNNYVFTEDKNISLTLYHTELNLDQEQVVAKISFPVMISPIETNYVTYQTAPAFNGLSENLADLSSLKDYSKLSSFNVYDTYKSGQEVNLAKTQDKPFGLAGSLLQQVKDGKFPYAVCLEGENGEITATKYGEFNKDTAVLTTLPSSKDNFVYFIVYENTQQLNIIALYRIKIEANSAINVYYPFLNSYQTQVDAKTAEYIYETLGQQITINLDQPLSKHYSNVGHKRVELNVFDEEKQMFVESTIPYTATYSIKSVNGITQLGTIFVEYGIKLENNVLTISKNNPNRKFDIVLNCSVVQNGVDMGTVTYTFRLNDTNNSLYSLKLGSEDFVATHITVQKGEVFDFSEIVLYKTEDFISTPATDLNLFTHYYFENQTQDASTFITETNKTLSLQDNAVSDKELTFVFYTVLGQVHKLKITFVSDYEINLSASGPIEKDTSTNQYNVYADTKINLKEAFVLSKGDASINLTNVEIQCYDNGNLLNGDVIEFKQIQTQKETHNLKIVIKLSEANIGVAEDYEFEISLNVLQSIISNYSNNPYELKSIVYSPDYITDGLTLNNIFSKAFTDETFLFESINQEVLSEYTFSAEISNNASTFVSFEDGQNVLAKTFDDILESYKLFILKSPDESNLTLTVTFKLSKTYADLTKSYLVSSVKFTIKPDILTSFVYPSPNQTTTFTQESIYLDSSYYQSTQSTFNFNEPTLFGTSRLVLNGSNITDDRIKIKLTSVDENLLINGVATTTVGYNQDVTIAWNINEKPLADLSSVVQIELYVDDVYRGVYTVKFDNNINNIFSASKILNLYDKATSNSITNPEVFYVDNDPTEQILSHKTALLTFTNQSQQKDITLVAYVKGQNASNSKVELGRITIGTTEKENNWLLINSEYEILADLSNVVIQVEDGQVEYHFGTDYTDALNVCHYDNFIKQSGINLQYRLNISYLGAVMDYKHVSNIVEANNTSVNRFTIPSRKTSTDGVKSVQIKVKGTALSQEYYYEVVYDFKATKAFSTKIGETTSNIAYSTSIISGLANLANQTFGVSGLTETFDADYFKAHNVNYYAQIIMITNSAFETSQTQENVRFLAVDKEWLMQQYFKNVSAKNSVLCAGISLKKSNDNNKYYDFDFSAYGAQNQGNYVYILVSYGTGTEAQGEITDKNISKFAYAILKVKIEENPSSIQLFNTGGTNNGVAIENHEILTYNQGQLNPLLLGKHGATSQDNNLIYIYANGDKNLINDTTGNNPTNLNLCGDIANYVYIDKRSDGSVWLVQKEGTVATYGDKTGYIQIVDMYGYEENYYLTLKASDETDAISIVPISEGGAFIGQISGEQNSFFSGTQIMAVDAEAEVYSTLGEMGAVKLKNFKKLEDKVKASAVNDIWTYQITYKIPELNYEMVCGVNSYDNISASIFTIPSITVDTANVTLQIFITVNHNSVQEIISVSTPMQIKKRFKLTTTYDALASVQAGTEFDITKYLSVIDEATTGANLGEAKISENVLTLCASDTAVNKKITLTAVHNTDPTLDITGLTLTIGKNVDDSPLTAVNGVYYYILTNIARFENIDFSDYRFTISTTETSFEVNGNAWFVADKIVSLTTSNIDASRDVFVTINNNENAYALPFSLNKNGVQSKSLCELVAGNMIYNSLDHSNKVTAPLIDIVNCGYQGVSVNSSSSIYAYNLSSTPVSASDLQTIKNFEIYDNSLALEITKINQVTLPQIDLTVEILLNNKIIGTKTYPITENISHIRYIAIHEILSPEFNLLDNIDKDFTVHVKYNLAQSNIAGIVKYNGATARYIGKENNLHTYQLSAIFKFKQFTETEKECINVLTSASFTDRIYQVNKFYLVKYLNQSTFENAKVEFNVTPKYYGLDNEKIGAEKRIYANQYTVTDKGVYVVDFNTWTSGLNLVNRAGDVITSLDADSSLVFKINDGMGEGSGSASLDANNSLVTDKTYKEGEYFVIEVWVPLNANETIYIGHINIQLIHSQVYVTNTGVTYMFIITHPQDDETIDATYNFVNNVTSISDLIFNNQDSHLQDKVDALTQTINIGGTPRLVSECNIEIVTIIDQIYSVAYLIDNNTEYLDLKLKLNETSSSINKTVSLRFDAISTLNLSTTVSGEATFAITKPASDFVISFTPGTTSTRIGNGVYSIRIPFKEIFSSIIGEDYSYTAKVLNTTATNAELLYAKRTQAMTDFEDGQTLMFALSFVDKNGNSHYTLIANKYSQALFETENYFTIDIQNLPQIDGVTVLEGDAVNGFTSNVPYYSIKFIGANTLNLNGNDLLISANNGPTTTYSIGKVVAYSADYAFEIKINSEQIYNQVVASANILSLTEYDSTKTLGQSNKYLPSVISIDLTSTQIFSIQLYGAESKIWAISPNQNQTSVNLDISQYLSGIDTSIFAEAGDYLMLTNITDKLTFTNLASGKSFWMQTGSFSNTIALATLTETTQTDCKVVEFDFNVLTNANSASQIDTINLTSLISPQANTYYSFAVQKVGEVSVVKYFTAKSSQEAIINVSLLDLMSDLSKGQYVFSAQDIVNSTDVAPITVYELTDASGKITLKAFEFTQINSILWSHSNILEGVQSAVQVNGDYIVPVLNQMTYITTTHNNVKTFNVVYGENTNFAVTTSTLTAGEEIEIDVSNSGFENVDLNAEIVLTVPLSQTDTSFKIYVDDVQVEVITVPQGTTVATMVASWTGITTINNLTILPN